MRDGFQPSAGDGAGSSRSFRSIRAREIRHDLGAEEWRASGGAVHRPCIRRDGGRERRARPARARVPARCGVDRARVHLLFFAERQGRFHRGALHADARRSAAARSGVTLRPRILARPALYRAARRHSQSRKTGLRRRRVSLHRRRRWRPDLGSVRYTSQSANVLLGKILRIDVNVPDGDPTGYVVPPDNPFVGMPGARPEIWALGLRNPWRFSLDNPVRGGTGALVIADVGQDDWEEVNYQPQGAGGRNYGWSVREGKHDLQEARRRPRDTAAGHHAADRSDLRVSPRSLVREFDHRRSGLSRDRARAIVPRPLLLRRVRLPPAVLDAARRRRGHGRSRARRSRGGDQSHDGSGWTAGRRPHRVDRHRRVRASCIWPITPAGGCSS